MKWKLAVATLLIGSMLGVLPAGAAVEIKIALVTPEGSTWTNTLYRMAEEMDRRTGGEVTFKIYAGGISGDELDVLRKMRVNQVHAAGFSGVGLGVILPEIRIIEAPLLFQDYAEVDFVRDRLFDRFSQRLDDKGFVLLGFAEAGFVYLFSKTPIGTVDGIRSVKMWAWKGDPVAETFLKTFGIKAYPLHVTDVNTGLETGMIDAFYSPPLAAVAFQWYAKIRYVLDYPMVNSTGALLMKKSIFKRLSPEHQRVLREVADTYCRELIRLSRRDNEEALAVLTETGIRFDAPTPELKASFFNSAQETYRRNIPDLYSQALFDTVQSLLSTYRSGDTPTRP